MYSNLTREWSYCQGSFADILTFLKAGALVIVLGITKMTPTPMFFMKLTGIKRVKVAPDPTTKAAEMCTSIDGPLMLEIDGYIVSGLFSERHWPKCTCDAYREQRDGYLHDDPTLTTPCCHIEQAQASVCGWHSEYSPEYQEILGVCPRCGGPTIPVLVAV